MSKANPQVIGAFIVTGLTILVASLIALGSAELFKEYDTYVAFFQSSVKGLERGSPVTYRGIQLGQVKEVFGLVTSEELDLDVQVVFEIDANLGHRRAVSGIAIINRLGRRAQ